MAVPLDVRALLDDDRLHHVLSAKRVTKSIALIEKTQRRIAASMERIERAQRMYLDRSPDGIG
jgi:hypothetical protein